MAEICATWTGKWPCLCMGEWKLYVDGKDYSEAIPKDYRTESMGTYGAYKEWRFRDDWDVEWSSYTDGLGKDDWIRENKGWLKDIPADPGDIYDAFQASDFRVGSCGGCI